MKKTIFLAAICAVFLCSCETNDIHQTEDSRSGNGVKTPKQLNFSSTDEQLLYRTNEFSFNFLAYVSDNEEDRQNIILSPLSAGMMLGLLMNGATDETLAEIQTTLGFEGLSQDDINAYYQQLIETLPALDTVTRVSIANSIWVDNAFPVKQKFIDINNQYLHATSRNVDMKDNKTADIINKWAADNTNNLIKQVVRPGDIYNSVLILANALYFKGIWNDEFKKNDTRDQVFTTLRGEQKNVPMMHRSDNYRYGESKFGQLLELPYKGGRYCMDIILPSKETEVEDVAEELSVEEWSNILNDTYYPEVNVALPKFKLSYSRNITDDLQTLGIRRAMQTSAQFSLISDINTYLSWVKQFCYLSVDETGTEAAAVTIGGMEATSAGPQRPKDFIADRPFIIIIREKTYGTILFTAIIGDPTEE